MQMWRFLIHVQHGIENISPNEKGEQRLKCKRIKKKKGMAKQLKQKVMDFVTKYGFSMLEMMLKSICVFIKRNMIQCDKSEQKNIG